MPLRKKSLILLLICFALVAMAGCDWVSGDDDDDSTDGDVTDGDVTDGDAFTLEQMLNWVNTKLQEEGYAGTEVEGRIYTEKIPDGETLAANFGGEPEVELDGDKWLAVFDLAPGAMYGHAMKWFLIDDTGNAEEYDAAFWPILVDGDLPPSVFFTSSFVNRGFATDGIEDTNPVPTEADYGDAPEDYNEILEEYTFEFPVLEESDGARTLDCDLMRLGEKCSYEHGPADPEDPDGLPNFVNQDLDDGVFWTAAPATGGGWEYSLMVRIIIADDDNVPTTQYINVLADHDQDGNWRDEAEWVVRDYELTQDRDTDEYVRIPVDMPPGSVLTCGGYWIRVLLSDTKAQREDTDNWIGKGEYAIGEVEDFYLTKCDNEPPEEPDGDADGDADGDTSDGDVSDGDTTDGDEECGVKKKKHALVIYGPDNYGENIVVGSASFMARTLKNLGYGVSVSHEPANMDKIKQAIANIKSKVKCLDELFVYIIAHGQHHNMVGTGRFGITAFGMTPAKDVYTELFKIAACPGGRLENDKCEVPGQVCKMTVLIESCFSGSHTSDLNNMNLDGREVILSSAKDQLSWTAGGVGHLARGFGMGVVQGKADTNKDGTITPEELAGYINKFVSKAAGKIKQDTSRLHGAPPKCPCTCCNDGILQTPPEECERPGDVCTPPLGGSPAVCTDDCLCPISTDGDITDGDVTDGDVTDGDVTDGDVTDGDVTDGDVTDGDVTDGDVTDGDVNPCSDNGGVCVSDEVICTVEFRGTINASYSCPGADELCCIPGVQNPCEDNGGICTHNDIICISEYNGEVDPALPCPNNEGVCCFPQVPETCEEARGNCVADWDTCYEMPGWVDYNLPCPDMESLCCLPLPACEQDGGYCEMADEQCAPGFLSAPTNLGCPLNWPQCCMLDPDYTCADANGQCAMDMDTCYNMGGYPDEWLPCPDTQICCIMPNDCQLEGGYCAEVVEHCEGMYVPAPSGMGCDEFYPICCLPGPTK